MREVSWHAHICTSIRKCAYRSSASAVSSRGPNAGRAARYATNASRCRSRSESCSGTAIVCHAASSYWTSRRRGSPSRRLRSPTRSHHCAACAAVAPRRLSSASRGSGGRADHAIVVRERGASRPGSLDRPPCRSGARDPRAPAQPARQRIGESVLRRDRAAGSAAAATASMRRRGAFDGAVLERRFLTQPIELNQREPAGERERLRIRRRTSQAFSRNNHGSRLPGSRSV